MSVHIDPRPDGSFALFIDGDLQFDTRDEALYHESLALPALCLARPADAGGLRALICGGGDGLALRECLRFPDVASVDLVDYDPEIVELGRTRFADLNRRAFEDLRVTVHLADAWDFLSNARPYDVILCDFTVPRTSEDTRVFTVEWYRRVRAALAAGGVAAFNAVSPQATPEAFWCLRKTVRAAGLSALPYRVCVPSFRAQGYGVWAFMLAARRPLLQAELRSLPCPVATQQTDMARLWRGTRFSRVEREIERRVPVHTLDSRCLLELLLNPGCLLDESAEKSCRITASPPTHESPYDIDSLIAAIPIVHSYHTRAMIETLAEQVAGTVRALDLRKLVEALLRRAGQLPRALVRELSRLRAFLHDQAAKLDFSRPWLYRLFAALVIVMTLANSIAPDNAFAKGSAGLGHASMSRGYSGGFAGGRGTPGSFGSTHTSGSFGSSSVHISGGGFRSGYGRGRVVDIYGYSYSPRVFRYCGGGFGHSHTYYVVGSSHHGPTAAPEQHQALFVADDDMMVMDNGDVIVTLCDRAYLLATNGTLSLMSTQIADPLLDLYPDPNMFNAMVEQIRGQQAAARNAIAARRDWLGWVGWSSALFPVIADDKAEMDHLRDLDRRLTDASKNLGRPFAGASAAVPPTHSTELFVGCYLDRDGRIMVRGKEAWYMTDGAHLWKGTAGQAKQMGACPAELSAVLKSVLLKLRKELSADIASDDNDLRQLGSDREQIQRDMDEYQSIYAQHGYQSDYEVDYGTDSIPVRDAISRSQRDLDENERDRSETLTDRVKSAADLARIDSALAVFAR